MSTTRTSNKFAAYIELGKLRLSSLAILAVLAGIMMGSPAEIPDWGLLFGTLLGTAFIAIGGNAMNMYMERETDVLMDRTEERPIQTGRLQAHEVKTFALMTFVVGVALLLIFSNLYATLLCSSIFLTYVLIYTPMKRRSNLNTLVGAVPGALPPVVGYVAVTSVIDSYAILLFLIVFFWQIPHFLAIAWRYRDQYQNAGLIMLPVEDPDGHVTGLHMVTYGFSLLAVSVFPASPGFQLFGSTYFYSALILGLIFLATTVLAAVKRNYATMRLCFLTSIIYLPLVLAAMVFDRAMQVSG
jgi:heme o synthase